MRPYRGLTKEGKWIYGWYAQKWGSRDEEIDIIYEIPSLFPVEVIPETVGQFTGLKDKNGKDIYEGNIVKWNFHLAQKEYQNSIWQIIWDEDHAKFRAIYIGGGKSSDSIFPSFANEHLEIIGNIHQNPELLEQEQCVKKN